MTKLGTLLRNATYLVVGGGALMLSTSAHAALDEVLSANAANVSIQRIANHDIRVRQTGVVKEFADETGKVFAVHWEGVADLPAIFGSHYASYQAALSTRRVKNHHLVRVSTPEMTVDAVSYGRYFRGTVTLNQNVPAGVTNEALR